MPAAYLVNSIGDAGIGNDTVGDLRYCIGLANATIGPDTITFDSSIFGQTIIVFTEMLITDNVLIDGPGATVLTVAGTSSERLFNVAMTDSDSTVTIDGLTLTGGKDDTGGAILLSQGTLAVTGSLVTKNSADTFGGGIAATGGASVVAISDSTLSLNKAIDGGAIYLSDAAFNLTTSTVMLNTASRFGGGIFGGFAGNVLPGSAKMDGATVSENKAGFDGGGLLLLLNTRSFESLNSTIAENVAQRDGGGIYAISDVDASPTLSIETSSVIGNTAVNGDGGGIFYKDFKYRGNLSIETSLVADNTADDKGGGVFADGYMSVEDSWVTANKATEGGGVLHTGSEGSGSFAAIIRTFVEGNKASTYGGGIFTKGSSLVFTESTAVNNSAIFGGGIAGVTAKGTGQLSINLLRSTVTGNVAELNGGGVLIVLDSVPNYSDFSVMDTTIDSNKANNGGGVFSAAKAVAFLNSTISGNVAVPIIEDGSTIPAIGGGLYFTPDLDSSSTTNVNINNTTIAYNKADPQLVSTLSRGGGIYIQPGDIGLFLHSTIVATNLVGDSPTLNTGPDIYAVGLIIDAQVSLIGVDDSFTLSSILPIPPGSITIPLNPRLMPLSNYGGPTWTHALFPDSLAIDKGGFDFPFPVPTDKDQRGGLFNREYPPSGGLWIYVDIGAYELNPARVVRVVVNDGEVQRSIVNRVDVYFDQQVSFVNVADVTNPREAFRVYRASPETGPGAGKLGDVGALTANVSLAPERVRLTFSGDFTETGTGSLVDGNYWLYALQNFIVGATEDQIDQTSIRRYFGDGTGELSVDFVDFLLFRSTFGLKSGDAGYLYYFDFDGNNVVDFNDFLAFRSRFGTTLGL